MILRFAGCLDQLGDDMRRRRQVGIAHAEIDDVFSPVARLHLEAVDDAKHVGRQSFDSLKLHSFYPQTF